MRLEYWCGVSSDAISVCCGEVRVSLKAKPLLYQSIYVPTLTYGPKLWVSTETTRWQIQGEGSELPPKGGLAQP